MNIKFQFESQEVEIRTNYKYEVESWYLVGVDSNVVKSIAPEKWKIITDLIPFQVDIYKKNLEEERKEKERLAEEERKNKIAKFTAEIAPLMTDPSFELKIHNAYDFTLSKDGVNISAEYSNRVYNSGSGFGSHETNKPWKVIFHYKSAGRYSTREKTVKRMIEKISEELKIKEAKKLAVKKEMDHQMNLAKVLSDECLVLEKVEHGYYERGNRGPYTTYTTNSTSVMIKPPEREYGDYIKVSGSVNEKDDCVKITNPTIIGKFTLEQFKKLVAYVGILGVEANR
jgi:hypothetical protein